MKGVSTGFLVLAFALVSCRGVSPLPVSADPVVPVRPAEPNPEPVRPADPSAPVAECTPAGPEICGGRCGTLPAGCEEVVVCSCGADQSCSEGRCQARQPPEVSPDPDPKRRTRRGRCSCCSLIGGAYISEKRHRAQRSAYAKCIADGGACEGDCPIPS